MNGSRGFSHKVYSRGRAFFALVLGASLFSCATTGPSPKISGGAVIWDQAAREAWRAISSLPPAGAPENPGRAGEPPESGSPEISGGITPFAPPEWPEIPPVPEHILGKGLTAPDKMALFLLGANPSGDPAFVRDLARIYTEEAAAEGVNHDVAFAQMCLETGFLRYGGLVVPEMNNFCGLGSIGPGQTGEWFPDPRTGVRAHIQHLKAYATDEPLKQDLVDPRYRWVRYGSAPTIWGLSGAWASDRNYARKISDILERLYQYAFL